MTGAMPWASGTELRDDATGLYRWPQSIFPGKPTFYPSVTTVLDILSGGMRFAEAWFAAEYVVETAHKARAKEPARVWVEGAGEDGAGMMVDCRAIEILLNTLDPEVFGKNAGIHYLKSAGAREMTKRANRGSVVHDALEEWVYGMRISGSDMGDYVLSLISAGGYALELDYVLPYVVSALTWADNHVDEPKMAEAVLMNDTYSYAGTGDIITTLRNYPASAPWRPGEDVLIDAKASKQDQPTHELQNAAYFYAEWIGIKGTDSRIPFERPVHACNLYVQPEKVTLRHWPRIKSCKKPWQCVPFQAFLNARFLWQTMFKASHPVTIKAPKNLVPRADEMRLPMM